MSYHIRLTQFEGPLDLLLHLIRRDKINIYDIPISHITKEYLAQIEIMQELELELAGEFFVMAATLMRIKSQMLLPRRAEDDNEEEDPREELVRNLIEYRKFKEAAQQLAEKEDVRRRLFTRPPAKSPREQAPDDGQGMEVSVFDLVDAFKKVMEDLKKQITYRIEREEFTIEEKITHIRGTLEERSEVLFTELFKDVYNRLEVIVTFLAMLEMIKSGLLMARQMSNGTDIWLYAPGDSGSAVTGENADGISAKQ